MGFKFSDLSVNDKLILQLSAANGNSNTIELVAYITDVPKNNLAKIKIDYDENKILNFNNVKIDVLHYREKDTPIVWRSCQISYLNHKYNLIAFNDGVKLNRRGCFRVGVSQPVIVKRQTRKNAKAILKDVSLSGFALTDRDNELQLGKGESVTVYLAVGGFDFSLSGNCVRIDEEEDYIVYGFEMNSICKDLSTYISVKQRNR